MTKTKKVRSLSKSYGASRPRSAGIAPNTGERNRMPMSSVQRDQIVRQSLTRFVWDKSKPEELETLRYHLITARVLSGMTVVEAAQALGYANSTQLTLIESGERKTPDNYQFLMNCARVYACSVDFLLGLSPHMEFDSKVQQQHALMRGVEQVLSGISAEFATVMIEFTKQTQPVPNDFASVIAASERVERAVTVMRERFGLDDMPGSAPLVKATDELSVSVDGLRQKLTSYRAIEGYFDDVRTGKMQAIPFLKERYKRQTDPRQADLLDGDA